MGVQETAGGATGVPYSHQEPSQTNISAPKSMEKQATLGTEAHTQPPNGPRLVVARPPSTRVSLRAARQLWPAGCCSQRAGAQGGGRHHSCHPGPLSGHSQPCRSSSPVTMRVIFSQRFNTSQLASVQGGRPPSTRPAQTAGPARCLRRHRLCVTVCLSHSFSTASSNCPPKLQYWQKEI